VTRSPEPTDPVESSVLAILTGDDGKPKTPGSAASDEVTQILGSEGAVRSTIRNGESIDVIYQYANDDGSNMVLTFEDGKLYTKLERDLH